MTKTEKIELIVYTIIMIILAGIFSSFGLFVPIYAVI